jgi:7-cyano-7-deazaguanine synthase
MKSLLVYSGGLDSTVLLYKYRINTVMAVSFIYGAKHNFREIDKAIHNCSKLGIEHRIIDLRSVGKHLKSSLFSESDVPSGKYNGENMRSTVVPFRNGIMLSICAGIAESNDVDTIMIANHTGDHFIYPDCRPEFIEMMHRAVLCGTEGKIKLLAPFTNIDKIQIVKIGRDLGIDFSETWTCYNGREIHCGVCGSCNERKESFKLAKIKDPTEYEK